jgi:SAM-dependent methyltransferase
MPYTYLLPTSTAFTGTGLEGYSFGPLRQQDIDVYYIESEKGHDTFMVSKKITRTYYVLSGEGYFTIDNSEYNVREGMLIEVPPNVEYTYSGRMKLIAFARPRWRAGADVHTRWNPHVTCRTSSSLPGQVPWLTRLSRMTIVGKSPLGAFMRLNRWLWRHLPEHISSRGPISTYGRGVHALAQIYGNRAQAFSTYFLRNRPELELLRRLVEQKETESTVRVAVLGCSFGAEAYSAAWKIRSARPDLNLRMSAVDISPRAIEFASEGIYSLSQPDPAISMIFDRMSTEEMSEFFDIEGSSAKVKAWIREGIRWSVGDVGEPEIVETLGLQDIVIASNFLCHMDPLEAERCLRNISRLVAPHGYLFVSGIDLDVRTRVAKSLGWQTVDELFEEIHDGDPCLRSHFPWHYGGLEPMKKTRSDWKTRYAVAFQVPQIEAESLSIFDNAGTIRS